VRNIKKKSPPEAWQKHANAGGSYKDFTELDDARKALLLEQGDLCCFCMCRIQMRAMKIAHWDPQSKNDTRSMDWQNVMGACLGGDRDRHVVKHCDTAQGNTPIVVNPGDREQDCERLIHYLADGRVQSENPDINRDLDQTLNLNHEALKNRRLAIVDALRDRLKKLHGDGFWRESVLKDELNAWGRPNKKGQLKEYCQVGIYWLEKKLKRRARAR